MDTVLITGGADCFIGSHICKGLAANGLRRGIDACARTRADIDKERAPALGILNRIARDIPGVSV